MSVADFFTSEAWPREILVTYYTLLVIDLKTRRIHIAVFTTAPDVSFLAQGARNRTDEVDRLLVRPWSLIRDRDSKFTAQFRHALQGAGSETILTPSIFELQCLRRTLRALDRGGVPERHDE